MTEQEELHLAVRAAADALRERGLTPDKKLLRFNDCVAGAERYGRLGGGYSHALAMSAVEEVVGACFKGHVMHVPGRGPLTIVEDWMLPA